MIPTNKPASLKPSDEVKKIIGERDSWKCVFCEAPAVGPPHHWGIHNTEPDRTHRPLLVHHPANQICVCERCHTDYASHCKMTSIQANIFEERLRIGFKLGLHIDEDQNLSIYWED